MTMYAPSDIHSLSVSVDGHGGCGETHNRPLDAAGNPVQPWGLTCPPCEEFVLKFDPRWSRTIDGITETYDEKLSREAFEQKGVRSRDALMAIAMARMAGIHEIPPGVAKMIGTLPAHVPGVVLCGRSHENTPGSRFCRSCGEALSAPAPAAALAPGVAG